MSLAITYIDSTKMSLSDGSEFQFLPKFPPPKLWEIDDEVEVDELKMKMCRVTNLSKKRTIAEPFRIKGADEGKSLVFTKSMDGEYPSTHHGTEWMIEELIPLDTKIVLSDESVWSVSAAFTGKGSRNDDWTEGQKIEVSPISRGASFGRPKIQAYNFKNKDLKLMVTGKFLGFRQ